MHLIKAKTIADAWFQIIFDLFDHAYRQDIQRGSFEKEQYRLQYPALAFSIEYPELDMVPYIPPQYGIPAPTSEEFIQNYFVNYLMDPELAENETYKYASRIHHPMPGNAKAGIDTGGTQLDRIIEMLKKTPHTNQAILEIGSPTDLDVCWGNDGKCDPPCLRLLDWKVLPDNSLSVTAYFRSWDLFAGMPTNLGGIELLKQYVASEADLKSGPMNAFSAGAHIYGYQEDFARLRTMRNKEMTDSMVLEGK